MKKHSGAGTGGIPPFLLCLLLLGGGANSKLRCDYYEFTCPQLRDIVTSGFEEAFASDVRIAASLLRLHFHDCFVNGCDASVLLDNTTTMVSEKYAVPNKNTLRGFEVVDNIKHKVESKCPGVVSCADIIALLAQVSVQKSGGPWWDVLLGRKDGMVANISSANTDIPAPTFNLSQIKDKFRRVGLDTHDLVALSGAHSIGRAHCRNFNSRLYNFSGTGKPDPSLDQYYLAYLKKKCPQNVDQSVVANLDFYTPNVFDNTYFSDLSLGYGLLNSDHELLSTQHTRKLVKDFAEDETCFFESFARSMIRMGNITDSNSRGGIRRNCRKIESEDSFGSQEL